MKRFKGFTLIELIIAMAIAAIITTCAISFFVPANRMYADAYSKEKTQSVVNGINRYVSESIRYSKYMMVYAGYKQPPTKDEVLEDIRALDSENLSEAKIDANELSSRIKGIYIDNTAPYTYSGRSYTGRILKLKNFSTNETKLALTPSYYGANSLYMSIPASKTDPDKLSITNRSLTLDTILLDNGKIYSQTESEVDFPNMTSRIQGQIGYKQDSFDNTYIYFLRED